MRLLGTTGLLSNIDSRIIVGVKYCFRYNARNRAMRMGEDGEPINMENMPRPHRRRREKKLMTMDEVNEKFPMMKYKTWVSERAREGLPTAGGVHLSSSRANSLREADGILPDISGNDQTSTDHRSQTNADVDTTEATRTPSDTAKDVEKEGKKEKKEEENGQPADATQAQASNTDATRHQELHRVESSPEDDDEHIDAALPPECMQAPGDSCAICIDTLEDDDDVRGLTCGHTFHAGCVDPWLTSRRACCPLCKADYFTPKPRPNQEGQEGANNATNFDARANSRLNLPSSLTNVFRSDRNASQQGSSLLRMPGDFRRNRRAQRNESTQGGNQDRQPSATPATEHTESQSQDQNQTQTPNQTESTEVTEPPNSGMLSSVRSALKFGRQLNDQTGQEASNSAPANNDEVTPSQLESGTRTNNAAMS